MVRYNGYGTDSLIDGTSTVYDNGGINFSIINTRFTVTKAGLYHFEGTQSKEIDGNNSSTNWIQKTMPFISVNGGAPLALNSIFSIYKIPLNLSCLLVLIFTWPLVHMYFLK